MSSLGDTGMTEPGQDEHSESRSWLGSQDHPMG
jgi:hypothetical protein